MRGMNLVFVLLLVGAAIVGAVRGDVKAVGQGAFEGASQGVTLAIGLIGVMALWLGLLKIAERVGLVEKLSRAARPVFRPLFPAIPDGHPAISAMLLNIAANMMGLGNAATPFGIKAMEELETLNPTPGTATNAQALFLAINTASLQLVPTTVIALRASAHSTDPAGILLPTLAATACALTVAILVAKLSERARPGSWIFVLAGLVAFVLVLAAAAARWRSAMEKGSSWALALILVGI